MDRAIAQMNYNINLYSRQITAINERKVFNTHIVDTLTIQLEEYYEMLKAIKLS